MPLDKIIEQCAMLNIHEKRCIKDEYRELVIYNKDLDQWSQILSDTLGFPIKPSGSKPTKEDSYWTKSHGGIYTHQTLLKKEYESNVLIAMLWPWQNEVYVTLKMAITQK